MNQLSFINSLLQHWFRIKQARLSHLTEQTALTRKLPATSTTTWSVFCLTLTPYPSDSISTYGSIHLADYGTIGTTKHGGSYRVLPVLNLSLRSPGMAMFVLTKGRFGLVDETLITSIVFTTCTFDILSYCKQYDHLALDSLAILNRTNQSETRFTRALSSSFLVTLDWDQMNNAFYGTWTWMRLQYNSPDGYRSWHKQYWMMDLSHSALLCLGKLLIT
ncbi:hypothetical protein BC941DRAFT_468248 [Chlamydoabsidia padenii]|nr:hypothetical protein BC941DRAFT_468248 [Chlamydoabsidia padenii]